MADEEVARDRRQPAKWIPGHAALPPLTERTHPRLLCDILRELTLTATPPRDIAIQLGEGVVVDRVPARLR